MADISKPAEKPRWATSLAAAIVTPTSEKQDQGWIVESPPHQTFNWLARWTYEWLSYLEAKTDNSLGGTAQTTLNIVADSITPTGSVHRIDTEGGAASDDLRNIATTNLGDGRFLALRSVTSGRVVTVRNANGGAGQILTRSGTDVVLDDPMKAIVLMRAGSNWEEILTSSIGLDPAPSLAGNLDVKARQITTSTTNGNITVEPNGTGALAPNTDGKALGTSAKRWAGFFSSLTSPSLTSPTTTMNFNVSGGDVSSVLYMDFPGVSTQPGVVSIFRNTNTTDTGVAVAIKKADNTNTSQHTLYAKDGTTSYLASGAGSQVAIGATTTTEKLGVTGNIVVSGVTKAGSGTAGAPAYTFGSEITTGVYYVTTATLGITLAGTQRYQFESGKITYYSASMQTYVRGGDVTSTYYVDFPESTTTNAQFILFRNTSTTNTNAAFIVQKATGTNSTQHALYAKDGVTSFIASGTGSKLAVGSTSTTEVLGVTGNVLLSGVVKNADGSAATPAYSYSADTTTGSFRGTSGGAYHGIAVSGAEKVAIYSGSARFAAGTPVISMGTGTNNAQSNSGLLVTTDNAAGYAGLRAYRGGFSDYIGADFVSTTGGVEGTVGGFRWTGAWTLGNSTFRGTHQAYGYLNADIISTRSRVISHETFAPTSSLATRAVSTWTTRSTPSDVYWRGITWAADLGLFVAVANNGSGNHVMTSSDGTNWVLQSSLAYNDWRAVCYSPELKLLVATATAYAGSGVGKGVATSPDGVTWTLRSTPADLIYSAICWSPELGLFCMVSENDGGDGKRIFTSPDGTTWTARTPGAANSLDAICWSPDLGLFCALSYNGTGNRIQTSPDGITWTARNTTGIDALFTAVCWSGELGLFCAVSASGTIITSPDGITWTSRTPAASQAFQAVTWARELGLFVTVSSNGVGNRVQTSPDGITWTARSTSGIDNDWYGIAWSPQLGIFAVSGITGTATRIMTSKYVGVKRAAFTATATTTSGSTGLNLISNPDAESGLSNVTATGNFTVASDSTSPILGNQSFLVTRTTGGTTAEYVTWASSSMPAFFVGKAMQAQAKTRVASGQTTDCVLQVAVMEDSTVLDYTKSDIPVGDYQHKISFMPKSGSTYKVVILPKTLGTTGSLVVRVDDVRITDSNLPMASAITDWIKFTPTLSGVTIGNGTFSGFYRIVGDSMELQIGIDFGTTTSISGTISVAIPSGFTPDTSKEAQGAYWLVGHAHAQIAGVGGYVGDVNLTGGVLYILNVGATISNWNATVPATWGTNGSNEFYLNARFPLSNYGSNITLADRATEEYAAHDGTSTVYGPNGVAFPSITLAGGAAVTQRDLTFQTPIQTTDTLFLEGQLSGQTTWINMAQAHPWLDFTSYLFGARSYWTNSTTYRVQFGGAGTNPSNGVSATGGSWGSWARWRVRKVSQGALVGVGPLESRYLKGMTTNTAPVTGFIGEVLWAQYTSITQASFSGIRGVHIYNITNAGWYNLEAYIETAFGGAPGVVQYGISSVSTSSSVFSEHGRSVSGYSYKNAVLTPYTNEWQCDFYGIKCYLNAGTTLYMNVYTSNAVTITSGYSWFSATRYA